MKKRDEFHGVFVMLRNKKWKKEEKIPCKREPRREFLFILANYVLIVYSIDR